MSRKKKLTLAQQKKREVARSVARRKRQVKRLLARSRRPFLDVSDEPLTDYQRLSMQERSDRVQKTREELEALRAQAQRVREQIHGMVARERRMEELRQESRNQHIERLAATLLANTGEAGVYLQDAINTARRLVERNRRDN